MIKVELSVREALNMVASSHCSVDMFEKIVTSFESALGVNSRCRVTITLSSPRTAENLLRELTSLGCEGFLS